MCLFLVEGPHASDKDLHAINKLSKFVNVIPVISKADLYTDTSIADLKRELGS
jgi:septin family protein